MAWTQWRRPGSVSYITDDTNEIEYTDGDSVLDRTYNLITVEPIYSVGTSANTPAVNRYGARSLLLHHFGFTVSGSVAGIQLRTQIIRLNRVRDQRVQLWLSGAALGNNQASDRYDADQVYGDVGDTWGISGAFDYSDPSFGVVIDLAPHALYPSSTRPIIRSVELRLYLV